MELHIKNSVTRVIASQEILKHLSQLLSFEVPGAFFAMKAVPNGRWDGRKRLMKADGSFPAGLTANVIKWCSENSVKIEKVVDYRERPSPIHDFKSMLEIDPRDYQDHGAKITDDRVRGIMILGTGGGKTVLSVLIIQRRKVDTLFVTPDIGLREQAYETFAAAFGSKNVSTKIESSAPIVVANIHQIDGYVSSIDKNKKKLPPKKDPLKLARFKMLMIDEFHHAASDRYLDLNRLASEAYWRYGLTGTYVRPDGRDMIMHGVLSNVLVKRTTSWLISKGWLVPAEVRMHKWKFKGFSRFNYKEAYKQATLDMPFNNFIASRIRESVRDHGRQTLVLVRFKEHGNLLKDLMAGDAIYVDGDDNSSRRESIKNMFAEKKIKCLIATNIFGEGQDIPSIDCLINARLQESEIQTKQGIGRALRLAKGARNYEESVAMGKSCAYVEDFFIEGNSHLKKHSVSRKTQYESEKEFKVSIIGD